MAEDVYVKKEDECVFYLKHKVVKLAAIIMVVIGFALPAGAMEQITGDMVNVPPGKITGPLFTAGNFIVIDADVDGDVFAAGQDITINGNIDGDLMGAARTIRVNGNISGSIRCAVSDLDVNGEVGKSLTAAAAQVRLHEDSVIGSDALVFAGVATFSGSLGRQALGAGGDFRISGPVGSSVRLWEVEKLTVGQSASVNGDLTYGSPNEAVISPGAKITGVTKWDLIQKAEPQVRQRGFDWPGAVFKFITGLLVWGVLLLIFPKLWGKFSENILNKPGSSLGWGVLALLVAPLAALLLLITVIGIPLSMFLMMVYMVLLYAANIIVADAAGRYLTISFGWEGRVHIIWPFMFSYAVLILLGKIPVAGAFISLLVAALALGGVVLAIQRSRHDEGAVPPGVPAAVSPPAE
jgi:cytoskeletal protein CcmA (bactofilin family)